MKKKECPSCAMEVESGSRRCPICSYEFPGTNSPLRWVALLLALLFLFYVLFL